MKQSWRSARIDLQCTTMPQIVSIPGIIDIFEIIQNCEPVSKIGRKKNSSYIRVFRKDLIVDHLRENVFVPTRNDCAACIMALMCLKKKYLSIYRYLRRTLCEPILFQNSSPEIFSDSLIAGCLLQKTVGIGDRHNDNIFLSNQRGELFLTGIDHILGFHKCRFGIKRERAVFFVTPQMDYVLESHGLKDRFWDKFKKAFLVLRERKHDLLSLLFALRDSGCNELQTTQDVMDYMMENAFCSDLSDDDALSVICDQYFQSLQCKTTQMGNCIHILVH